jgi:hypothetical protein
MRRKTVNKNVLKAMTIGIAAVIATTSIPMDVYAATEGGQGGDPNEQNNQQPESQTEQQIDAAIEVIEGVPANEETGAEAEPGALDLIADADAKADAYVDTFGLEETDENKALQQELENAKNYIDNTEGTGVKLDENGVIDNENGKETNGADKDLHDAKTLVAAGFEKVDEAYEAMEDDLTGDDQVAATTNAINEDGDNSGKSDFVEKMQVYADSANSTNDYSAALGFQGQAQRAYDAADGELKDAQKKFQNALAAKEEADKAFDAANEKIEHAQINSAAAYKELQDAKDNLDALKEKATAKQEELEAIQKQYYALQVQYYRKAGINGDTTIEIENEKGEKEKVKVFGEDGKLNTDYAAQWIVEKNKVEANAEPGEEAWKIGRYLMKELIEAKLKEEGATDIVVGAQFKGSSRVDAWEVDVYPNEDEHGADQVIKKDINNKWYISEVGEKVDVYKAGTETKDRGRTNRFEVTYKKGNETITEYYNYVFKNPKYDLKDLTSEQIKKEMEEGPIYLAQIKQGTDGNWYTEEVKGANDNYKVLVNAINQYDEAEKARKAAEDKVAELQGQISEIEAAGKIWFDGEWVSPERLFEGDVDLGLLREYSGDPYVKLVLDLKIAEKELGTAQENVNEAKRILDSIDLSRFDGSADDDVAADDGDSDDAGAGAFGGTGIGAATGNTVNGGAFGGNGGQVLGANAAVGGGNTTIINDNGVPLSNGTATNSQTGVASPTAINQVNKIIGNRQNKDNSQLVKKIKDNEIPLAEVPNMDDEVTMNWMWLLIIFLLGATGKKMYDEYKKKKEAEEAAKINK